MPGIKRISVFCGLLLLGPAAVSWAAATGVLILAESGSAKSSARLASAKQTLEKAGYPTQVIFGRADALDIEHALKRFESQRLKGAICVPLLLSSQSEVFERLAFVLGKRDQPPQYLIKDVSAPRQQAGGSIGDKKDFINGAFAPGGGFSAASGMSGKPGSTTIDLRQAKVKIPVKLAAALDDHPLVARILLGRVQKLSKTPAQEVVVLVSRGAMPGPMESSWLDTARRVAGQLRQDGGFGEVQVFNFPDTLTGPLREKKTAQIRTLVQQRSKENRRVIIVPYQIESGGVSKDLTKALAGLFYKMGQEGLAPDPLIDEWIVAQVKANE